MRKIEKEENKGIELEIKEEVRVDENILEEGDRIIIYPSSEEEISTEEESSEKQETEK